MANEPANGFWQQRIEGWLLRHQLPVNFWLHMVGIPLVIAGILALFLFEWYWGVAGILAGYLLQWIGHLFEGNDLGEWAAIKRWLGWPYVGISPRWNPEDPNRL